MANAAPREAMATSIEEELVEISGSDSSTICSVSSAIFSERYEVVAHIGDGGQGSVCRVKRRSDGRLFACKTMRILEELDSTDLIRGEVRILEHLKASRVAGVVGLEEVIVESNLWHIILELCSCSLHDRISLTRGLSHPEAARLTWSLAKAVEQLHRVGVIHRDLKPPNVLLTFTGSSSEYQVKVADFGLAVLFADGEECGDGCISGSVGTRKYFAPEVARGDYYDKKVDVWGIGLILYEAVSGRLAFSGRKSAEVMNRLTWVDNPGGLLDWSGVASDAKEFIIQMLQVDPRKRLTTEEIQTHPWVAKHCPELVPKAPVIQMKKVNGRWRLCISNQESQVDDEQVKQEVKQEVKQQKQGMKPMGRRKQEVLLMEKRKQAQRREEQVRKMKRAREDSFPSLSTWVKTAKLKLVDGRCELRYPEPVPKGGSPPMKMMQQFVNGERISVR